jgi:hypothetical protein
MDRVMLATVGLVLVLGTVGSCSLLQAFRHAGHKEKPCPGRAGHEKPCADRAQVWGALGAGLLTGAAVAFGVVLLQQWDTNSAASAVWRADVETAASIPGFSPDNHSLLGLDLSGKDLHDADLRGADLKGVQLRDTDLTGADLTGADLQGADLTGATLKAAILRGADLSGAQIYDTQFEQADIRGIKSLTGAQANVTTCWPPGFLETQVAKGIRPKPWDGLNGDAYYPPSPGRCAPSQ